MNRRDSIWKPIATAAIVAVGIATLGGALTDTGPWYQALKKPSWQPPNWLFGPAWTTIFALAVVSATLAWRSATTQGQRVQVIALFAINAFFNLLWSALFFALKRPDWALFEVGLLWLAIAAPMVTFWSRSKPASLLLAPYLAWVTFAAYLNWTIVQLNAPFN